MTAPPSPEIARTLVDSASQKPAAVAPARLESLDAFRGLIMLMMASAGLEITRVATTLNAQGNSNRVLDFIGYECNHAEWIGMTLWDIIQPAFMFMVGVALPWSIANRRARGQSEVVMLAHALWRAAALVLLSVFLQSNGKRQTDWTFPNVLAQIGLAYPFLFAISFARPRVQWIFAFGILIGYWLLFALYQSPPLSWQELGLKKDWSEHLSGFASHWERHLNPAGAFDRWFLNLFPRPLDPVTNMRVPFLANEGGYQTLNFIPSLGTMIFGALAGELLRSEKPILDKIKWLSIAGAAGVALGFALSFNPSNSMNNHTLDLAGLCPMIKRIWTPSFAIYSAGWVALLLAAFVAVMELQGWKKWAFPLVVAGLNPITLYCMWQMVMGSLVRESFKTHLGQGIFQTFGTLYEGSLQRAAHLLVMWLILWWMYRRKIFIRI